MEAADAEEEMIIDSTAVSVAVEKRNHPERWQGSAYNIQTAVDAEHTLIVRQVTDDATDNRRDEEGRTSRTKTMIFCGC